MKNKASPRQVMKIIDLVEKEIWKKYKSYKNVLRYIKRWQQEIWDIEGTGWNGYNGFNFEIVLQGKSEDIDLSKTLDNMEDDLLFQVAVDMGVEIPNIIYAVPEIIRITANDYQDVHRVFESAFKKVYEDPSNAVALANSALETIVKRILQDIKVDYNKKDTLYKLSLTILKEFKFPFDKNEDIGDLAEVRNIGSGLVKVSQAIENIRSKYTKETHGKLQEDYIIDNPLYAQFVVNSVSCVGLLLLNFYEQKYKVEETEDDLVDLDEEIPF